VKIRGGPAAVTPLFPNREKEPFQLERITALFKPGGKIAEKAGKPEDDRQTDKKSLMAKGSFLR
jgi:hypothetical protein